MLQSADVLYIYIKKNAAGRISLRGSNHGFSNREKPPTLAHAHKSHALRRAQREGFFYPYTACRKIRPHGGSNPGRQARGAT